MPVFRVSHTDMMGNDIRGEFYDSKSKAKRALRRMLKELMPTIAEPDEDSEMTTEHKVYHRRPMVGSRWTYHLMFTVWHKCNYEYDEWDTYVESLHIEKIEVR